MTKDGVLRGLFVTTEEAIEGMRAICGDEPFELHALDCSVKVVWDEDGNGKTEGCDCGGGEIDIAGQLVTAEGRA